MHFSLWLDSLQLLIGFVRKLLRARLSGGSAVAVLRQVNPSAIEAPFASLRRWLCAAREPNSLSPTQGNETELGLLDIAYVGRVIPAQAQIFFRASRACHELGSLCSGLRSELLSCKLRTVDNARRVSQPTVSFDYRPQKHEEPGLELANEYSSRLRGNLIRSGHSEHQLR